MLKKYSVDWSGIGINKVSMMAELAALLNEVAHPLGSARNYACAAQNFMDMRPPHLGEVKEALSSIVVNVDRAGEIIDRISEDMKKTPSRKERFDLNATVHVPIQGDRSTPTSRFKSDDRS